MANRTINILLLFTALLLEGVLPTQAHAFPGLNNPVGKPEDFSLKHDINTFSFDRRSELPAEAPWTAIGKVRIPVGKGKFAGCSGTLVGPNLVLTNAHCVVANGKKFQSLRFAVQYRRGESLAEANVVQSWPGTPNPVRNRAQDWAFLRLDKNLGDQFGWFDIQPLPLDALVALGKSQKIFMAGYSRDQQNSEMPVWQSNCRITSVEDNQLVLHSCSGIRGSSGSSITYFHKDQQRPQIIAIQAADRGAPGGDSRFKVPYSAWSANIAVPAKAFYPRWKQLSSGRSGD